MAANDQREDVKKWLEAWYNVGDKCIPPNSIKWFASDCVVQFNNGKPVHGKEAAQHEFESIAPLVAWMSHRIIDFDIVGDRIYNECEVSYIAADDPEKKEVKMHRINVYDRIPKGQPGEGLIKRWMAFFDSSPFRERVIAAQKAKGGDGSGNVY